MNKCFLALAIAGGVMYVMPLQAYIYSFSNHTNYPLIVSVQLAGINEPWETRLLAPRGEQVLAPIPFSDYAEFAWTAAGHPKPSINIWKAGFCLQNIRVQTPIIEQQRIVDEDGNITYKKAVKIDPNTKLPMLNPPRNVSPKWVKSEAYDKIVAAGVQYADGMADMARAAITLVTGIPLPKFQISGVLTAIGEWVGRSLCKDRHFDIIQDEDIALPNDASYVFLVEAKG